MTLKKCASALLFTLLASASSAAPTHNLVPQIDAVGAYSIVAELPVIADQASALSDLAPSVSRRISGRVGERVPLNFNLELNVPAWQPGPAWLLIQVDRISAGGASLEVRIAENTYSVQWISSSTFVVSQNLLVPIPVDASLCVVEASAGVVVVDAYQFYKEEAALPAGLPLTVLIAGEVLVVDAADSSSSLPPLGETQLEALRLVPGSQAYNRRAYSVSPHYAGLALEDVWPTHWLTRAQMDVVGEQINNRRQTLPWVADYIRTLEDEAETVLASAPQIPIERVGWRHDYYARGTAEHLWYNPNSPDHHLDPLSGQFYSGQNFRQAWVLLTHERTFKIMRSLGMLYQATGDERYAEWVAEGMRRAASFVETAEASGWERSAFGGTAVWYQPLYDATALLALANVYGLTRESSAYSSADHERIRQSIFEARIPHQMAFLQNIGGLQNMAAYAAAAVALAGELYDRADWLAFGVGESYGFVRWLEANVPSGPTGEVDGLWNEQTTFYHFYALAPLITLYNLAENISEENRARFRAMFDAPLALVQGNLQLHLMGDLAAPGHLSLVDMRSFYEFAAGQLDAARFGPVLTRIYRQSGLERGCIWSILYGPEQIPQSEATLGGHVHLPVSGFGVFRDPLGMLTVGVRGGAFRGGHDHPDRLSIFIEGADVPVARDLGEPGYAIRSLTEDYYRRTIAHNGPFANERDNRGGATLDWRADAAPPRARGVIANFEGVRYERTVYFDPPFVVVVDDYSAADSQRFGSVFHGEGELEFLNVTATSQTASNPPFNMPVLPSSGVGYKMITERRAALVTEQLHAQWTLSDGWKLAARILGDDAFEATQARSPGNPFPVERGALLLRAPGTARTLVSVYELHQGEARMKHIAFAEGAVQVTMSDGSVRTYAWEDDASESYAQWTDRVFGNPDVHPAATASGSGQPYLALYASGYELDHAAADKPLSIEWHTDQETGERIYALRLLRNLNAINLAYSIETSSDLLSWRPWYEARVQSQTPDSYPGREVLYLHAYNSGTLELNESARFYRLSLQLE